MAAMRMRACMTLYVCMRSMHVCMSLCLYAMYVCMFAWTPCLCALHAWDDQCMYASTIMYACRINIHMHVFMHVCIHAINACIVACIHASMHAMPFDQSMFEITVRHKRISSSCKTFDTHIYAHGTEILGLRSERILGNLRTQIRETLRKS